MTSSYADALTVMQAVTVKAPARLHLGFLDLNASSGRRFGSIGLAIDSLHTLLTVSRSTQFAINGLTIPDEIERKIRAAVNIFYTQVATTVSAEEQAVTIELKSMPPAHSGFGSGTQLALAIGSALTKLHALDIDTNTLAQAMKRGQRSGIGIATFQHGGFVIDGGIGPNGGVPPILIQQPYPQNWRVVLILDPAHQGMHGKPEKEAFECLPAFPQQEAEHICHQTLMKLLPALHDEDITAFGEAITDIQNLIGDHFAPAQGGRYASPAVTACLEHAQRLGFSGIAQSSWGPTGCIFVESEEQAKVLTQQLQQTAHSRLRFITTSADNTGTEIEMISQT